MKDKTVNGVIGWLDDLRQVIASSETISGDIPILIEKTDKFVADVDEIISLLEDDEKRLKGELNRCARNLTAMKILYFQRLDGTDATKLAITPEEIKERLTGWIDILVKRLKEFLEN